MPHGKKSGNENNRHDTKPVWTIKGSIEAGESGGLRFSDGQTEASQGAAEPPAGEDSGGGGRRRGGDGGGNSFEKARRTTIKLKIMSNKDKLKRLKKYVFAIIFACKLTLY